MTAIVYHGTGDPAAIPLQPSGHQKNAGFLARLGDTLFGGGSGSGPAYYVDNSAGGPDTAELDVGAPAGTHVYAPVSGQVVADPAAGAERQREPRLREHHPDPPDRRPRRAGRRQQHSRARRPCGSGAR